LDAALHQDFKQHLLLIVYKISFPEIYPPLFLSSTYYSIGVQTITVYFCVALFT
jgi:hypothetical protein